MEKRKVFKSQRKPRNMETLKKLIGCLKGQDEITDRMLSLRDDDDRDSKEFTTDKKPDIHGCTRMAE